ncbi:NAD(P)-binding protein [Meredithblackwellia eburnea MCA 4105]
MALKQLNIFVLGATGYIGGSAVHGIFTALNKKYSITLTALVRKASDGELIVNAFPGTHRYVLGSFTDLALIKMEASKADFVLNCADADNQEVVDAILAGIKDTKSTWSPRPVYLHTSGTSVVRSGGDGTFVKEAEKIWDDSSVEDIESIDKSQPHRLIDLSIFSANDEGYVDAYIITPSCIYGTGTGPVRTTSAQIPELVRLAVARQQALHIGPGTAVWNSVHVHDLEKLYALVAEKALKGDGKGEKGVERFFFASVEVNSWGEVVRRLAGILHKKGKIPTATTRAVSLAEEKGITAYFPSTGTNSVSKSSRGKALGWEAVAPSLWDTLESDVEGVLKEYDL